MLTITVPKGARCALYPDVPSSKNYAEAIDRTRALSAAAVTAENEWEQYCYDDLTEGIYHCTAEADGCNAVCQVLNYKKEKDIKVELNPHRLAGNGYEAGYVMLNTPELIETQLASGKNSWGPEYAGLFCTPQFLRSEKDRGRHQQTTNEELIDFILRLDAANDNMHIYSLGKSPKYAYDIPLVLFTKENVAGLSIEQAAKIIRSNGKPTVQYSAQCHSTEPVSAEGALAMMVRLCGEYGERVLDAVDVYIIPRINPDGAFEAIRRSPTTGEDMNRDYLYMNNQEIRMVTRAYNLFLPEVAIDGHEKGNDVLTAGASICTDLELQVSAGALNHPAAMTQMGMDMALAALSNAKKLGLRGHFYTKLASGAGGYAGSSYYGNRNSISFLIETSGQLHLGMAFMERRVISQFIPASALVTYTATHAREVMETVHGSREYMASSGAVYDENDVITLEHGKAETGVWSTPLIHVPTGKVVEENHGIAYTEHSEAIRTRPRPTAYLIPVGTDHEDEILRVAVCHCIDWYRLCAGSTVSAQQYIQTGSEIDLKEENDVSFPQGAYVFPNTVPSTILGMIMEPDFYKDRKNSTLLSMGLIEADEEGRLPLYRYCHNLQNGRIPSDESAT